MTSSIHLQSALSSHKTFGGCYHLNSLPCVTQLPKSYIILIDNSHWISLVLPRKKQCCYYFDSFGEGVKSQVLVDFLRKLSYKKIVYNQIQIQHNNSEQCGWFCFLFLMSVQTSKKEFRRFINIFDHVNLLLNDFILEDEVCNKYFT